MNDINHELKQAKDALAEQKLLSSDATENNRNVILTALVSVLQRIWKAL